MKSAAKTTALSKLRRSIKEKNRELKILDRIARDQFEKLKRIRAKPAKRPKGKTLRMIPKKSLNAGRWYLGIGRGSNVAFWTGSEFCYFEEEMGEKRCNHWDDGPPFGCFQPFEEISDRKYGNICQYIRP